MSSGSASVGSLSWSANDSESRPLAPSKLKEDAPNCRVSEAVYEKYSCVVAVFPARARTLSCSGLLSVGNAGEVMAHDYSFEK